MMKTFKNIIIFLFLLTVSAPAFAVEVAPRISDREIVERLSRLEDGQSSINKRIDDLRSEMNGRFSEINGRFNDLRSEMNRRFSEMNSRFNDLRSEMNSNFYILTWMIGLFVTVSMVVLGFVLRMQWQMNRRQAHMESALETQKDEMLFMKGLIEKLLPSQATL